MLFNLKAFNQVDGLQTIGIFEVEPRRVLGFDPFVCFAAETTTTTANDITYSAVIEPSLLAVAMDIAEFMPMCREFDIVNKPSNAIDVPRPQSDFGTVPDAGAGVDTEFDATQGTALSNIDWGTDKVTGTSAEYGVQYEITDNVIEDSVDGIDVIEAVKSMMMSCLVLAINDDICALFAGLSNSVGTTTVDATVANMLAAQVGIRVRGWRARDGVVYVLDNDCADDIEAQLTSTNAAQAVFAAAADRLLGYMPTANNGLDNGHIMSFRGYPVWATGLTDTANAAADVVSACFTPAGPQNNPSATFALVWKRLFRLEFDRDISKRTTKAVLTVRCAPFELTDGSGTKLVTDNN